MGFLSSRFLPNNSRGNPFHSSGVVNETSQGETLGSTSTESFEQRKVVEHERKVINRYADAQVVHGYRTQAASSGDLATSRVDSPSTPQAAAHAQRAGGRSTSRVDVVRRGLDAPTGGRGRFAYKPRERSIGSVAPRPSFREPGSRGYNPYK